MSTLREKKAFTVSILFLVSTLTACQSNNTVSEHCSSWFPKKTQVARVHLNEQAKAFYYFKLSQDPDTFVFETVEDAQLAGFDMTAEDCDEGLCLSFREVITGPKRTSCRPAGLKSGSICNDGTLSPSKGKGSCSHHGGVKY